jgi:hypothetical protein
MSRDALRQMERFGIVVARTYLPRALKHLRWARMNLNTIRHEYLVSAPARGARAARLHQRLTDVVFAIADLEQKAKDTQALATHLLDEAITDREDP